MRNGDTVYVGHMGDFGVGTSVVDVSDLGAPRLLSQTATPYHTHAHKVQLADDLLLVNQERYPYDVFDPARAGVVVYDVSRPRELREIGYLAIPGLGVHRIWWVGGDMHMRQRGCPGRTAHGWSRSTCVTLQSLDCTTAGIFPSRKRRDLTWASGPPGANSTVITRSLMATGHMPVGSTPDSRCSPLRTAGYHCSPRYRGPGKQAAILIRTPRCRSAHVD